MEAELERARQDAAAAAAAASGSREKNCSPDLAGAQAIIVAQREEIKEFSKANLYKNKLGKGNPNSLYHNSQAKGY